VPKSNRRKAGIKLGDKVEFSVTGVINILERVTPAAIDTGRKPRL